MAASLVTGPTVEPVTLAEAKAHLALTSAEHDARVAAGIIAARQYVENVTRRALITQTWDFTWDWDWPADWAGTSIVIPLQPLISVTTVTYVPDGGGTATLTAGTQYQVVANEDNGRIVPAYGVDWPSVRSQPSCVTVRAICGYGASGGTVPEPLRLALLLQLEILHDRDPQARETLERARDSLLDPYRVVRL